MLPVGRSRTLAAGNARSTKRWPIGTTDTQRPPTWRHSPSPLAAASASARRRPPPHCAPEPNDRSCPFQPFTSLLLGFPCFVIDGPKIQIVYQLIGRGVAGKNFQKNRRE